MDLAYDVVVLGGGGPGMTAALSARAAGASVILIEATAKVGGTTAFSGGQVWVPNNHHQTAAGLDDSADEALAYFRAMNPERGDEDRWGRFIAEAPDMLLFLEDRTPLRFKVTDYPDSFVELEGGKASGRNLEAVPFRPNVRVGRRGEIRYPPSAINRTNLPFNWDELHQMLDKPISSAIRLTPRLVSRLARRRITGSRALVAGLYEGCRGAGVEFLVNARARSLITDDASIVGVRVEHDGEERTIGAGGGVILATGAFDWDPELIRQYLPGRIDRSASLSSSRGDGLRMARDVGAHLRHLDEAWYWAGVADDHSGYEGSTLGKLISNLRSFPHTMIVNRSGQRFGNESAHNFGNALQRIDEGTGELVNLPAWAVFDQQFRKKHSAPEIGLFPRLPAPKILQRFDTIEQLSRTVGIDHDGLAATLQTFNDGARQGRDSQFQRGDHLYDRCYGGPTHPHPNLGTIEQPPFYAVEVIATSLGTKGGPATNTDWRVTDADGTPIPGLYAVGNVSDCMTGPAFSGGDTLSMGMTAGYIAGQHAPAPRLTNRGP